MQRHKTIAKILAFINHTVLIHIAVYVCVALQRYRVRSILSVQTDASLYECLPIHDQSMIIVPMPTEAVYMAKCSAYSVLIISTIVSTRHVKWCFTLQIHQEV
jgi:hypothetical protein